jgi:hypothetical protein
MDFIALNILRYQSLVLLLNSSSETFNGPVVSHASPGLFVSLRKRANTLSFRQNCTTFKATLGGKIRLLTQASVVEGRRYTLHLAYLWVYE